MIIKCENCGTKFRLADFLLKRGGSKVRCTRCEHVFMAYPPQRISSEQEDFFALAHDKLDKTVNLDSKIDMLDEVIESERIDQEIDFDEFLGEPVNDSEEAVDIFPELKKIDTAGDKLDSSAGMGEDFFSTSIEEQEKEIFGEDFETDALSVKGMTGKSRLFTVFLVIILLFIGASAVVFFRAPELIPDSLSFLKSSEKQEIRDAGIRRLGFKAVTGVFVDSNKSGQIFVIRGIVVNNYPKSRSFILVKGKILDSKGQVVRNKTAYAGNTFKDEKIRTLSLEEIERAVKDRYGMGRKNLNLSSGASIPFMIVFENLPENMSEFTVEAVSSFPGK